MESGKSNEIHNNKDEEIKPNNFSINITIEKIRPYLSMIKKAVKILERQREIAIKDIETIEKRTEEILSDHLGYITTLMEDKAEPMPSKQKVVKIPNINMDGRFDAIFNPPKGKAEIKDNITQLNKSNPQEIQSIKPQEECREEPLPETHGLFWTEEENRKLLELLEVYPPEEKAHSRYEKISKVLGTRTAKQISSRVQKLVSSNNKNSPYYNKILELTKYKNKRKRGKGGSQLVKNTTHIKEGLNRDYAYNQLKKPLVYMSEDDDDSKNGSVKNGNQPEFLCNMPKKVMTAPKAGSTSSTSKLTGSDIGNGDTAIHIGYQCSLCSIDPIVGPLWRCLDCNEFSQPILLSLCDRCITKKDHLSEIEGHTPSHRFEKILSVCEPDFMDMDYAAVKDPSLPENYLSTW